MYYLSLSGLPGRPPAAVSLSSGWWLVQRCYQLSMRHGLSIFMAQQWLGSHAARKNSGVCTAVDKRIPCLACCMSATLRVTTRRTHPASIRAAFQLHVHIPPSPHEYTVNSKQIRELPQACCSCIYGLLSLIWLPNLYFPFVLLVCLHNAKALQLISVSLLLGSVASLVSFACVFDSLLHPPEINIYSIRSKM